MSIQKTGKTILGRIRPNKPVEQKRIIYETTKDIFERKDTVLDVAKDFRKRLINPISDWQTGLPAYGEDGYEILRQTIASYTNYVEKLKPQDAERFTKLAIGENQLEAIESVCEKNIDIKVFKETLEKSLGRTIRSVILPD